MTVTDGAERARRTRLLRRTRRALFPIVEREFTYGRYASFLDALANRGAVVVPLRDLVGSNESDHPIVGLRHDVDESLESALELARLEHQRGMRATYFVLHTAPYWQSATLLDSLRRLQDEYGHEIGWHNDLVTLHCFGGSDAGTYLEQELERLRSGGISVVGSASHGSPLCHRFGYHNNYIFAEFADELVDGFPNNTVVETPRGTCTIPRLDFASFGLTYEAYHLPLDAYFSDTATMRGTRWHPRLLDPSRLAADTRTVVLIHPCHWDASVPAKFARLGRLVAAGRWRDPAALPQS